MGATEEKADAHSRQRGQKDGADISDALLGSFLQGVSNVRSSPSSKSTASSADRQTQRRDAEQTSGHKRHKAPESSAAGEEAAEISRSKGREVNGHSRKERYKEKKAKKDSQVSSPGKSREQLKSASSRQMQQCGAKDYDKLCQENFLNSAGLPPPRNGERKYRPEHQSKRQRVESRTHQASKDKVVINDVVLPTEAAEITDDTADDILGSFLRKVLGSCEPEGDTDPSPGARPKSLPGPRTEKATPVKAVSSTARASPAPRAVPVRSPSALSLPSTTPQPSPAGSAGHANTPAHEADAESSGSDDSSSSSSSDSGAKKALPKARVDSVSSASKPAIPGQAKRAKTDSSSSSSSSSGESSSSEYFELPKAEGVPAPPEAAASAAIPRRACAKMLVRAKIRCLDTFALLSNMAPSNEFCVEEHEVKMPPKPTPKDLQL